MTVPLRIGPTLARLPAARQPPQCRPPAGAPPREALPMRAMARLASGRIVLWDGGALWIVQVPALPAARKRTDFHAHHAIQITLALDGQFDLHFQDRPGLPGPAVMVSADVSHAFEPRGLIG